MRIVLVRHGEASAGWGDHADPGLSLLGHRQARAVAEGLAPARPMAICTSPLRRTRETAGPLAEMWDIGVAVEPRVAEIPSPTDDVRGRSAWLQSFMAGTWASGRPSTLNLAFEPARCDLRARCADRGVHPFRRHQRRGRRCHR